MLACQDDDHEEDSELRRRWVTDPQSGSMSCISDCGERWHATPMGDVSAGHRVSTAGPCGPCRECGAPSIGWPDRAIHAVDLDEHPWAAVVYACQWWTESDMRKPELRLDASAIRSLLGRLYRLPWIRALYGAAWDGVGKPLPPELCACSCPPAPECDSRAYSWSGGRVLGHRIHLPSSATNPHPTWRLSVVTHEMAHIIAPSVTGSWLSVNGRRQGHVEPLASLLDGPWRRPPQMLELWDEGGEGGGHSRVWAAIHLWLMIELGQERWARVMMRHWSRHLGPLPTPEVVFAALHARPLSRLRDPRRPGPGRCHTRASVWAAAARLPRPGTRGLSDDPESAVEWLMTRQPWVPHRP
jgi:hypothetical protein